MLSDVHGTHIQTEISARNRYATPSIIALLVSVSVALVSSFINSDALAQSRGASLSGNLGIPSEMMPALGNTPEADRLMLREISDQYVSGPDYSAAGTHSALSGLRVDKRLTAHLPNKVALYPGQINPELQNTSEEAPAGISPSLPAASTTWQFVRQSTRLTIPDNEQIANYREQYLREAMWISKILNRASPFVGHIVEELDKRYLPVELALLPAIESGYQPDVHSAENAAGIWQIVPATAEEIGLKRTQWFDERADITASTTAAIDYLSYLNAEFHGDWLLTLAAYNAGPGRVRGAIKRNRQKNLPTDFWSLRLPTETKNYVPKFLALVAMLRHDTTAEFEIPTIKRGKAFEVIDVGQQVSLDKVAEFSQINEKTLRLLNASLVHAVTPPAGPHTLNVPLGLGDSVLDRLSGAGEILAYSLPSTHTVIAGDSLSTIAKLYRISQRRLMKLNELEDSLIKVGQQLTTRNTVVSADNIEYVVTIGDTLSAIAQRFSVRIDNIRTAEGEQLGSDVIHPGVRLSIVVDSMETG